MNQNSKNKLQQYKYSNIGEDLIVIGVPGIVVRSYLPIKALLPNGCMYSYIHYNYYILLLKDLFY